jgi:hypothetical protein
MRSRPALKLASAALALVLALSSCSNKETSIAVKREQLFALGYGTSEDQIDLFQLEGGTSPLKTRIAMREGIFYVSNGNGAKVIRLSSFGDVLSMIYNPEKNPEPQVLKTATAGQAAAEGAGRRAQPYPFRAVGEIAVGADQTVYVEDRLPPERRVQDKESGALLDYVVLRFGKDGQFLDYLGQEGIGGTPFPYILGVYALGSDECVVVSMTQTAWLVHRFDARGAVLSSVRLRRDALPLPEKGSSLIASLDKIVPDPDGRSLIIKVDYYRDTIDPSTKSRVGVEYASSWAYRMDPRDASYPDKWQIPVIEKTAKGGPEGQSLRIVRVPELLGAAGSDLFFLSSDDDGKTYFSAFDRTSRDMTRYSIDIASDELLYDSYFLSREGILCALLGSKYEARIVWWRFDKIVRGLKGQIAP